LFKIPNFTNVELTDMVLAYGAAGGNAVQAQILYGEEYLRFLSDTLPKLVDEVPLDMCMMARHHMLAKLRKG
jgi:hypothetical protein